MPETATQGAEKRRSLYPPIEPFAQDVLPVSGGHLIYVEQCGNPDGQPVIVLHGGPGGGCSPTMRRFFDPRHYRVILFDQRGCGRSRPHASVEDNTTWDLIDDIEAIRRHAGVDRLAVFGGSWGATLALIYAETHPDRVRHLVLRGVFLMTEWELSWFYGGGAGAFWPKEWAEFCAPIPPEERGDMIAAYHRRLFGPEESEQVRFARAWSGWESALAVLEPGRGRAMSPGAYARAFARQENHYFINRGFLEADGQILRDAGRLAGIPGDIVQGRYDMVCPPRSAWALSQAWPAARLRMMPVAGHALSEPQIAAELVQIMDELR